MNRETILHLIDRYYARSMYAVTREEFDIIGRELRDLRFQLRNLKG